MGEFGAAGIQTADGMSAEGALAITAAIKGDSEHVIAKAIRGAAASGKVSLPQATGFEIFKGHGARAQVIGAIM